MGFKSTVVVRSYVRQTNDPTQSVQLNDTTINHRLQFTLSDFTENSLATSMTDS